MKRPETFDDIKGHDWLVTYLTERIRKGTLHHFIIFEGLEGLGKTSLADVIALSLVYGLEQSEARHAAYESVVVTGESNDNIKRFKCSVDGGKDVARLIKDEMNSTFTISGPKVIICDECHGLTDQAQDVFLSETEFISDNVYIIMLTTELSKLKASLLSRAIPIHLNPLKKAAMMEVLKAEVISKNLRLQNEDAILSMIAEWAEYKPRTGLNLLNAFDSGDIVSNNSIRELIGYLDTEDVLPLLASLAGSMTYGLSYINEMIINQSLVNVVIECLCVKNGAPSYKLKMNEIQKIRQQLTQVSVGQLTEFLFGITKYNRLTKTNIINAYISAHSSRENLVKEFTRDLKTIEDIQRADAQQFNPMEDMGKAPSIEELLLDSKIIN